MPPSFRPAAAARRPGWAVTVGPDPHLERVLLDVNPLDQQLDDPLLLGREQLAPDRGKVREQDRDLALGDLILMSALYDVDQVRATSSGAASSFWMWSSTAPSTSAAGTHVTVQVSYPSAIASRVT